MGGFINVISNSIGTDIFTGFILLISTAAIIAVSSLLLSWYLLKRKKHLSMKSDDTLDTAIFLLCGGVGTTADNGNQGIKFSEMLGHIKPIEIKEGRMK